MKKGKILIIVGTRPEIIKISPLIRYFIKHNISFELLHTGQHYSYNMDKIFFDELQLPLPDYFLEIGSGSDGYQIAEMMKRIEKLIFKIGVPKIVLIQGDTNTVLASALICNRLGIKIAHIEAGLRSYDKSMPEEINRILTDHISDYLFAPTSISKNNLLKEGIDKKKIFVVGNTVVEAVKQNLPMVYSKIGKGFLKELNVKPKEFFLLTLHRRENVDKKEKLEEILEGLKEIKKRYKIPILFPIHPRTVKNLKSFNMEKEISFLNILEPMGYLQFLLLIKNSRIVLTDSGGIQEESCILKVPCVTLRENTERPETLEVGANILAGWKKERILEGMENMLEKKCKWENPFGDGKTSERIYNIIKNGCKS